MNYLVQSAGGAEYTYCICAEEYDTYSEFPVNDTKQSNGEAPVTLELWEVWSTPSLLAFPGQL